MHRHHIVCDEAEANKYCYHSWTLDPLERNRIHEPQMVPLPAEWYVAPAALPHNAPQEGTV